MDKGNFALSKSNQSVVLDKIQEYENNNNIIFPSKYRMFLLNNGCIPSDLNRNESYYIKNDADKILFSNCLCDVNFWLQTQGDEGDLGDKLCILCKQENDIEIDQFYSIEQLEKMGYYKNYFILVGDHGCTDQDYLCVKGTRYGEIWSNMDGGDYFGKSSSDEYYKYK